MAHKIKSFLFLSHIEYLNILHSLSHIWCYKAGNSVAARENIYENNIHKNYNQQELTDVYANINMKVVELSM